MPGRKKTGKANNKKKRKGFKPGPLTSFPSAEEYKLRSPEGQVLLKHVLASPLSMEMHWSPTDATWTEQDCREFLAGCAEPISPRSNGEQLFAQAVHVYSIKWEIFSQFNKLENSLPDSEQEQADKYCEGDLVKIQGLKSEEGKKINGMQGFVIGHVAERCTHTHTHAHTKHTLISTNASTRMHQG